MTPALFLERIMHPAAVWVEQVTGLRATPDVLRFILAIAGQESACTHRFQILSGGAAGPARGNYQFEQGGGVRGVMLHRASAARAALLCEAASVRFEQAAIWRAIEGHDGLAYGFARLLVLTDPAPIPTQQDEAWQYYLRCWRPGKPHPDKWPGHWEAAGRAVGGGGIHSA